MSVDRIIRRKFGVTRFGGGLPLCGWKGSREVLAQVFAEAGYKVGAEIGVKDGEYSEVLCKTIPGLKLKCVDVWVMRGRLTGRPKPTKHFTHTRDRLTPYGVELLRMSSMDAVKIIPDDSLDFVHIDAAHDFDNAVMDIVHWSKKVRPGGMMSGHDYERMADVGVIEAVEAYTRCHAINPWYVTWELPASWCWVKQ